MTKTFAITPVHDLLLRGSQDMPVGLYHLHLATAEQLTRLHYKPGMFKHVHRRLKALMNDGYVQADTKPTRAFKGPNYYTVTQRGFRYLESTGMDISDSLRASKEADRHYLFIDHHLELNDILIAALRLKFADPRYYLSRYVTERTLRRTPYKVAYNGHTITLIPDGFLDFHKRSQGQEPSLPLILEHDRSTEQQEHFKRRIRAYKGFLTAGGPMQLFGASKVTVAFTSFISSKRVLQMREWTYQELTDSPQLMGLFVFTELSKPLEPKHLLFDRRWYTLTDGQPIALLEG